MYAYKPDHADKDREVRRRQILENKLLPYLNKNLHMCEPQFSFTEGRNNSSVLELRPNRIPYPMVMLDVRKFILELGSFNVNLINPESHKDGLKITILGDKMDEHFKHYEIPRNVTFTPSVNQLTENLDKNNEAEKPPSSEPLLDTEEQNKNPLEETGTVIGNTFISPNSTKVLIEGTEKPTTQNNRTKIKQTKNKNQDRMKKTTVPTKKEVSDFLREHGFKRGVDYFTTVNKPDFVTVSCGSTDSRDKMKKAILENGGIAEVSPRGEKTLLVKSLKGEDKSSTPQASKVEERSASNTEPMPDRDRMIKNIEELRQFFENSPGLSGEEIFNRITGNQAHAEIVVRTREGDDEKCIVYSKEKIQELFK